MSDYPNYGSLDGPVIMIGFGSIGRGTLPLILRHFDVKPEQITVVAPDDANAAILAKYGVHKLTSLLTADNYRAVLTPLLATSAGRAFCVNLSVDTSSVAIMALARVLRRPGGTARATHELRLAPEPAGRTPPPPRRADGGLGLRGEPGHGLVVREAGPARCCGRCRARQYPPHLPYAMGRTYARVRRPRNPHRRT